MGPRLRADGQGATRAVVAEAPRRSAGHYALAYALKSHYREVPLVNDFVLPPPETVNQPALAAETSYLVLVLLAVPVDRAAY